MQSEQEFKPSGLGAAQPLPVPHMRQGSLGVSLEELPTLPEPLAALR